MAQTANFSINGLYTFPNDTVVPQGSLVVAKNVDLSKPGLATPRRGFDNIAALSVDSDRAYKLFSYSDTVFSHVNGTSLQGYISSAWVNKGSIDKPVNAMALRAAYMSKCLFLTSSSGLQKLDSVSGILYPAGIPKGLHMALTIAGAGTALNNTSYAAYRYLIAKKDAQNNTISGGVSARAVIQNSAGSTQDINVKCYLPTGLTTSHFLQLYKTKSSSAVPGDEMQLCYEAPILAGDITNGYLTIRDIVVDELLGASLYTSPSQQGIANDNSQPPLASDITEFKNYLFFGDVEGRHKIVSTLIACGGSSGLVINDTFTIASGATSEVYTAKAADLFASKQFTVDTASASVSLRIDNTIRRLVDCINQTSTLVYAYLLSTGDSDLPGKIVLEARQIGAAAFTIASSRATCWSPQLTSSPGASQTSTNDSYKNGLMFSKLQQPEAVPSKNIFFVGSSDDRIKRVIGLKDSLIVLKEKDGAYVVRGQNEASFTVDLLDSSAKIIAPESAVVVNNLIYALTQSGIVEISDNGVSIISLGIKDKINTLVSSSLLNATKTYAFGMGYETEGKYYLCAPSAASDTQSTYQLIFDVFNKRWSESDLKIKCGFVNPTDNRLYTGSTTNKYVRAERKNYDFNDFADFEQTCTITAQTGSTLTITGIDAFTVGDVLLQGTLEPSYVVSVDLPSSSIVVDNAQVFTLNVANVSHLKGIQTVIEWSREFSGNPAGLKHFSEAIFAFKNEYLGSGVFTFRSDTNPGAVQVGVPGASSAPGWGYVGWDESTWDGLNNPKPLRVGIPYGTARCNALSVSFSNYKAFSGFELSGLSLVFNPTSTRTTR